MSSLSDSSRQSLSHSDQASLAHSALTHQTSHAPRSGRHFIMKHGSKLHAYDPAEAPWPFSYDQGSLEVQMLDNCVTATYPGAVSLVNLKGKEPSRCLDLGTGLGLWAIQSAKYWRNSTFVGFDLVDIQIPLSTIPPDDACRIEWVYGNIVSEPLPFKDEEFEHVRAVKFSLGIPETKWPMVFEEIRRVMKPGATFEMVEEDAIFPVLPRWFTEPLHARTRWSSLKIQDTSKIPLNPITSNPEIAHEYELLEILFNRVFERRFINTRPSSMLPACFSTYFSHVVSPPVLTVPMPPLPAIQRHPAPRNSELSHTSTRPSVTPAEPLPMLTVDTQGDFGRPKQANRQSQLRSQGTSQHEKSNSITATPSVQSSPVALAPSTTAPTSIGLSNHTLKAKKSPVAPTPNTLPSASRNSSSYSSVPAAHGSQPIPATSPTTTHRTPHSVWKSDPGASTHAPVRVPTSARTSPIISTPNVSLSTPRSSPLSTTLPLPPAKASSSVPGEHTLPRKTSRLSMLIGQSNSVASTPAVPLPTVKSGSPVTSPVTHTSSSSLHTSNSSSSLASMSSGRVQVKPTSNRLPKPVPQPSLVGSTLGGSLSTLKGRRASTLATQSPFTAPDVSVSPQTAKSSPAAHIPSVSLSLSKNGPSNASTSAVFSTAKHATTTKGSRPPTPAESPATSPAPPPPRLPLKSTRRPVPPPPTATPLARSKSETTSSIVRNDSSSSFKERASERGPLPSAPVTTRITRHDSFASIQSAASGSSTHPSTHSSNAYVSAADVPATMPSYDSPGGGGGKRASTDTRSLASGSSESPQVSGAKRAAIINDLAAVSTTIGSPSQIEVFPLDTLLSFDMHALCLHLRVAMGFVHGVREAMWEELAGLVKAPRPDVDLDRYGFNTSEDTLESVRGKYVQLLAQYESDMHVRMFLWHSLVHFGWDYPQRDPVSKAEETEELRLREDIILARERAGAEREAPCRSVRIIVGAKEC